MHLYENGGFKMLLKIYPENPNPKDVRQVVEVLRNGGIIIYPTDTVYGLGCDITNAKAVEKIARYKNVQVEKSNFSFICSDLSHLSGFSKPVSNQVFKMLKSYLPGPFHVHFECKQQCSQILQG